MYEGPLHGIRVLDLTTFLSGPYATQMLADLGAEIIKIEPPGGDSSREIPPHFVGDTSAYFLSVNRNKKSVCLDLKSSRARQILIDLAARCDLLIENFRPGVLTRLGLGPDQLRAGNPALVICSISGFGQDGPAAQRPAYDVVVQALSGGMSMTGELNGEPVRAGVPIGDLCAGLSAGVGSLAALLEARKTGRGRNVDVSMLDVQISMLSYQAAYYLLSGEVPGPQGRDHVSIPTYHSFQCNDKRWLVIAANTERMWQELCTVLGLSDLPKDPRFASAKARLANKHALWDLLGEALLKRTAAEWANALEVVGVPAAALNDVGEALNDPQVRYREMVQNVTAPGGDPLALLGGPIRVDGVRAALTYPPALGQHNDEVLSTLLGLSAAEIAKLANDRVVLSRPTTSHSTGRGKEVF
jgi:CoA:oxalate CoA-transferase